MATLTADIPVAQPVSQPGGVRRRQRIRLNVFRYVTFVVFGLFFLLPLGAMVRFSFEGKRNGSWSVAGWKQIATYNGGGTGTSLLSSIEVTLELALVTSGVMIVLVLPTMIWVRLKVRWFTRTMEFLSLLPLTIPAIVLVVGLAPVYNRIERFNVSAIMLFWAYVVIALPYAYRALAAGLNSIDVTTLSEAARSLGSSWFTVMARVIAPNMWQAILNSLLLTVALVLGEFTIASNLTYVTLQPALFEISRSTTNPVVLFSASAASLLFAFLLLMILSYVGRRRRT